MTRVRNGFLSVVLMGMAGTLSAAEEKSGPNAAAVEADRSATESVRVAALADQLAIYGIESADWVAIVQAAKMKNGLAEVPLDVEKTSESIPDSESEDTSTAGPTGTSYDLDADALLERAESMAGENAMADRLIAEARATKPRGARGGRKWAQERVLARSADRYKITFVGGLPAAAAIRGDGRSNLNLYVYDENNNLICKDVRYGDRMYCGWKPRWSGPFTIVVRNTGRNPNVYRIETN